MVFLAQSALLCALLFLAVLLPARGSALSIVYFYPKAYRDALYERGLADRTKVEHGANLWRAICLPGLFLYVLLSLALWSDVQDFPAAWLRGYGMLLIMNWFDGICIDRLWVGRSRFWVIPGMEDVPYVQTWTDVLKKRGLLTVLFLPIAALIGWLATLF